MRIRLALLGFVFIPLLVTASSLTQMQKSRDFDQICSIVETSYGPLQYKDQWLGVSIRDLQDRYRKTLLETTTNHDFYYGLVKFFAEFRDSHTSMSIPTTHRSFLGFTTDLVEGKVVIDSVNRQYLPAAIFPYDRGDEIVSLDGKPIADVLSELGQYIGAGYQSTKQRYAAMAVSSRAGSRVPVATGPTIVAIRPRATPNVVRRSALNWIETGSPLDEASLPRALPRANLPPISVSVRETINELLPFQGESSYVCSGATREKIPADATILTKSPFVAYYHPTPKGKIGYLRIPHYLSLSQGENPVSMFAEYAKAIMQLEKETVGLIIDQDHNCGGEVAQVENLIRLFMPKPFPGLQFRTRATKGEYLRFQGQPWVADAIWQAMQTGQFLTAPISLTRRNPAQGLGFYTKPVLILIDEMAGSGGDAFPAMMQGFGRAKLLGTRTMGAGGHVEQFNLSNTYSATSLRLTRSLFFRPDGTAVENNGANPDIPYTITMNDYVSEYADYQAFYTKSLLDMIP